MKALALALLLLVSLVIPAAAQDTVGFLARGNVGYDVLAGNLVFGGGAGYYFPLLGAYTEVMADLFTGFYSTSWTSGNYDNTETGGLAFIAVHYDYMLGYVPGRTGLYGLIGAGFFAGATWWHQVETYTVDSSQKNYEGGGSAAGPLLDIGAGFAISRTLDIRVDVPVLVYTSGGVSIPIIIGVIYRF